MGIRQLKPTTNGQRNATVLDFAQVTGKASVKRLLKAKSNKAGRNNGTISIRHRGGGSRTHYRVVDFNGRAKMGVPGVIAAVEYDPNRTCYIALVHYKDGDKRYRLAHKGAFVGQEIMTDKVAKIEAGNRMEIQNIPVGFTVYNLEVKFNKGGEIVRSAGTSARLVSLEGEMAQVELPSGEIRFMPKTNMATIGVVSNEEQVHVKVGKAGRTRHKGRRPQVRGKAMNPNDHPHGGGEGGCPIGMAYPKTPWGAHALGVRTRSKKASNTHIVRSRHRAKKR